MLTPIFIIHSSFNTTILTVTRYFDWLSLMDEFQYTKTLFISMESKCDTDLGFKLATIIAAILMHHKLTQYKEHAIF